MAVTTLEIPPKKPSPVTATSDVAQSGETSAQQVSEVAHTPVESLVETDARVGIQNYGRLRVNVHKRVEQLNAVALAEIRVSGALSLLLLVHLNQAWLNVVTIATSRQLQDEASENAERIVPLGNVTVAIEIC